ncbi:DUF550 domain-containing protein [Salmonella enterica subsp. enterica]|nr:DUF550 domain-containing protein [Salmonella enterica subsp. enterica serovar Bovismorbificans]
MKEVKIYTIVSDQLSPPITGESFCTDMVRHSDYAELEAKYAALAADNDKAMESLKQADAVVKLAHEKFSALAAENEELKYQNPTLSAMMSCLDAFYADDDVPERAMMAAYNILRKSVGTPATDAFLAEMRAQAHKEGAYFVANRMLAAWDAGFIDDTAKNAADIARMILTSTEFMADAPEGDFDRSFADGVIEDIAAPPAPVVPEEMPKGLAGQIVSLLAHNIGDKLLAQKIWNACRAAMLQGAEPVSQTYNLPELIEGMEVSIDVSTCGADAGNRYFGTVTEVSELYTAKNGYILLVQDAEPNFDVNGNSPAIPDDWVMVPKEPTQAMIKAWLSEVANFRGHAAGYKAALAAAPQREVK